MFKRFAPWIVLGVFIAYLGVATFAAPDRSVSGFDLRDFRRLPVSVSGRVQPLDTLARVALLGIRGSESIDAAAGRADTASLPADEWLLEVFARPDAADARRIFPIHHAELLEKLSLAPAASGTSYYAFRDLAGKDINPEAQRVARLKAADRADWEQELLRLHDKLVIYERLKNSLQPNSALQRDAKGNAVAFDFSQAFGRYRADMQDANKVVERRKENKAETLAPATEQRLRAFAGSFQAVARIGLVAMIPPHRGEPRSRWSNVGTEIANSTRGGTLSPAVKYFAAMSSAYAHGEAGAFAAAARTYRQWLADNGVRHEVNRAAWEVLYNDLQPMFRAVPVYVVAMVLLFAAPRTRPIYRAAVLLVVLGFALHTAGIGLAFTLAGRPSFLPFAGWATALCGLVIEWFSRRGFGMAVAGIAALAALGGTYALAPGGLAAFIETVNDLRLLAATVAAGAVLIAAVYPSMRQGFGPALAGAARQA